MSGRMPFFCPQCGTSNPDQSIRCQACGYAPHSAQVLPPVTPGSIPPGKINRYSIASFILGIFFCFCPAALLAVTYGHRARKQLRKDPSQRGAGLAITGLILGYVGIAVTLLAIVIALPDALAHRGARINAHESSAVGSLRTINTAEAIYSTEHSKIGFTSSLQELAGKSCAGQYATNCVVDGELADGTKSEYRFTYAAKTAVTPVRHYTLHADPLGNTRRHFFTDETGIIRVETDHPASASSPPL